jgi:DNA-binding FadR family transcriptional regulator
VNDAEPVWDEERAVRQLEEAGRLVAGYEAAGASVRNKAEYHRRIVAAHEERDADLYEHAVNGLVEASRAAYRRSKGLKI